MMLKKFSSIPSFFFSVETVKSAPGHKPPVIADTAPGKYAGSLFTSSSKFQALDFVLKNLTHLSKIISQQYLIREFLKNSAIKRNQQIELIALFALQQYHRVTNNFEDFRHPNTQSADRQKKLRLNSGPISLSSA